MNRFSLYSPGTGFVATVHFHGLGLGGSLVNILKRCTNDEYLQNSK
jgi:hypothetical protein